jgi:general secretion pathway protein K
MKSIYELYYVKGIDKKVFDKLADYLTVYGDGKINVNSASKDVLMALSNDMTETAVDSIIESRPITKIEKLKELPGIDQELYFKIRPLITNVCNYFKIDVTASYGDATAEIVAFTDRDRVYEWKVVQ